MHTRWVYDYLKGWNQRLLKKKILHTAEGHLSIRFNFSLWGNLSSMTSQIALFFRFLSSLNTYVHIYRESSHSMIHFMWIFQLLQTIVTYSHLCWGVAEWEKNNLECHLPGVIWDLFRHYFLHNRKPKDSEFFRAGGTQAKQFAQCGQNGLCMLAAISKRPSLSIFQYIENNALIGLKWPQVSGIPGYFFLTQLHLNIGVSEWLCKLPIL